MSTLRRVCTVVAAAVLVGSSSTVALADNVYNTVDGTIDATAEVMALNVGGALGSTTLAIQPTNGDGKNGCNLSEGSLTVSVNSSHPGVATVSPSSVTFASCGDTPILRVAPVATGSTTISLLQTSNTTAGTFDLRPATFTVNVAPPANTAPRVAVQGVAHGGEYEIGAVPTATCAVTDTEDGNSTVPVQITGTLSHGLGSQTATCSYTDRGGLTASSSATYSIFDTGDPTIRYTLDPSAANAHGWFNRDVAVDFTCADAGSGVQSCTGDTVLGEGANQSVTGTATDFAGNTASVTTPAVNIDKTDPTVELLGGPTGTIYFGDAIQAPTCIAQDGLSGLVAACAVTGGGNTVGTHSYTSNVADRAGNTARASLPYSVLAWTHSGFYSPVDMNGVVNTVRGGSTVPLKFELFAGNRELTSTDAVKSFVQTRIACATNATVDEIEVTTTGGTSLRYDATAGQFVQNWQTPKEAGACYRVTMTTHDGTTTSALFKLR